MYLKNLKTWSLSVFKNRILENTEKKKGVSIYIYIWWNVLYSVIISTYKHFYFRKMVELRLEFSYCWGWWTGPLQQRSQIQLAVLSTRKKQTGENETPQTECVFGKRIISQGRKSTMVDVILYYVGPTL